jgi:Lon protease-like protein
MEDYDLVNLLCTHLPLGADDKQALLETDGVGARADLMRGLMEMSAFGSVDADREQRH